MACGRSGGPRAAAERQYISAARVSRVIESYVTLARRFVQRERFIYIFQLTRARILT